MVQVLAKSIGFFIFCCCLCIIYNNYNFNSLNAQWLIVTSLQQSSFADTRWALTEEISLSPANFNSILNTVADYFLEIISLSHVVQQIFRGCCRIANRCWNKLQKK